VPKSRIRKKPPPDGPLGESSTPRGPSRIKRMAAPAMLTCWLLGLIWVVLYYALQDDLPLAGDLGGWNLVIGMGLIGVGFIFATQWE
jgi:Cell division protein CrgA